MKTKYLRFVVSILMLTSLLPTLAMGGEPIITPPYRNRATSVSSQVFKVTGTIADLCVAERKVRFANAGLLAFPISGYRLNNINCYINSDYIINQKGFGYSYLSSDLKVLFKQLGITSFYKTVILPGGKKVASVQFIDFGSLNISLRDSACVGGAYRFKANDPLNVECVADDGTVLSAQSDPTFSLSEEDFLSLVNAIFPIAPLTIKLITLRYQIQ